MKNTEEVMRLVGARSRALVERDAETMEGILAEGFVYTHAGGTVIDRETYLARYLGDPGILYHGQDVDDIRISFHGDTAIVTCRVRDRANFYGYELDSAFQSTWIYLNRSGSYECIAGHTTAVKIE